METAARQKVEYVEYDQTTRVYSYSRAATAETLPYAPVRENNTRTRVQQHPTPAKNQRKRTASRALALIATLATAAVLMALMIRYAMIAQSYTEINELTDEIELAKQDIASLNVKLNTAVSIDEARAAATDAGMGYPTAEQIVRVTDADLAALNGGE